MGCLSGEGLFLGTMIPVPCEVIHLIVHTQNNGSNLPQFLISDPWNKGQFGYSTIQTGQYFPWKLIKRWNVTKSVGLAPVSIFKTINVNCPSLWSSVFP